MAAMTELIFQFRFILDYPAFTDFGGIIDGTYSIRDFTPLVEADFVLISHEAIRCAEFEGDLVESDLSLVPDFCPHPVEEVRSFSAVMISNLNDYDFPPSLNEEHTYLCALAKMTGSTIVSGRRNYSFTLFKDFATHCGVSVIETSEALQIVRNAA